MSELIKLEKSDEMLKEIKRKANRMFTLEDAIWSHECIAIMQLIDEELERRNTRTDSSRFTAEERGAMEFMLAQSVCSSSEASSENCPFYIKDDEKNNCGCSGDWSENVFGAIATVRAMLTASEIADKGKE